MDSIGLWQVLKNGPSRLQTAEVAVERDLEDWIEGDPGLLERGLVVVGRQLRLEGGLLDLVALDAQGRWVLIEIKRERLRREVIGQTIDYASCFERLDTEWLREKCDAYLTSKGKEESVRDLLERRGRSLETESALADTVIYLVGTSLDPGLERMVGMLARREALTLRVVTFSAFRNEQGMTFLARKIHEGNQPPVGAGARGSAPSLAADEVLKLADQNGLGGVVRVLYKGAMDLGFYARPYAKSMMFAPPANRTRCLFVVWVEGRRQPGVAKAYIAAEAFEEFYGIRESELVGAVGPVEDVTLDQAGAERVTAGLRRLLPEKVSE
jgi:Holliday junction resolvase-like predicted endonuclease